MKLNNRYDYKGDFPFVSPCGVEMNYIKSEELPIVYNKIVTKDEAMNLKQFETVFKKTATTPNHNGYLLYAGDQLWVPFEPSRLSVNPETGRLYHPCADHLGGVALIASALASELSNRFKYLHAATDAEDVNAFELKNCC